MVNKNINIKIIKTLFFSVLVFIFFSFISFLNSSTYISDAQRQIIRDTKRLNDLTVFRKAIEDYKAKNGFYPKLETGTNIKGYVNSTWSNQWTSFCGLIGLSSCPVDPLNEILNCDCSVFSLDNNCLGDNINSNIDKITCYNSKTQSFACSNGSHLYQYQSLNNGRNYSLMMEFEYSDSVDWQVDSFSPDNFISVKGTCTSGQNQYKVLSNKTPKCGDGVLNYSEACETGSKKIEYCKTSDNKNGIRYVDCSNNCLWNYNNVGQCIVAGFCGDGIVQADKGEECDGGHQKMCYSYQDYQFKNPSDKYANNSHYNWYNEQLRYCSLNCKWNSDFIDSTSYCGGFCGDGVVQADKGEECDNFSDVHCDASKCKNKNSAPKIIFDFINNRNSNNTYIKSNVWSGDKLQYPSYYNINGNTDLVIADKQQDNIVAIWNSDFIEIKVNGSDVDGDELNYKYKFEQKFNIGIKIKYYNISENKFLDYKEGDYVKSNIIRVYPTSISSGINNKNYKGDFVFDSSYIGFYSLKVTVSDLYNRGNNSNTNILNAYDVFDINFKIGPGCGDRILQKELGEICEFKPNEFVVNIFTDWALNKPDNNSNNNCVIFDNSLKDTGKWNNVSCDIAYFGLCERRAGFGCDGWVAGVNDNCYKFTSSSKKWEEAKIECESYNGKLVTIDTLKESSFIKSDPSIYNKNIFWLGYKKTNNNWFAEYGSYWRPNNDNKNIFRNKIYVGGNGLDNSNQYSCGVPWSSDACRYNDGYCGDGLVNRTFEECDYNDKNSFGKGAGPYNTYECDSKKLNCTLSSSATYNKNEVFSCSYYEDNTNNPDKLKCNLTGGYCGDSYLETKYEHCDPKDRITASNSSSKTFGVNPIKRQYVCKSVYDYSDYRSSPYNNIDDYNATKNNDVDRACRKSYGGYCGDGKIQMFYSLDNRGNYYIDGSNINNQSDNVWKTIKYDTASNKYYFLNGSVKNYFTQEQENMFIEECDPLGFESPTPANSSVLNQYGGCGEDNNSNDVCVRNYDATGKLISSSGNCACRKLAGGYCGDGYLQNAFNESCEITSNLLGLDNLSTQFCTKCVKMDCSNSLNMSSGFVYLVRNNVTVNSYSGYSAIMNALSASQDGDYVFVNGGNFDFDNNYSIDLGNRKVIVNSCTSSFWNWR